jgi:hypothetical protein
MSVVVLAPDLMDRSKITAVAPGAVTVRDATGLVAATSAGDLVVVDLSRPGVLAVLSEVSRIGARVIGFGSHVDRELLAAARAAGCAEVLTRSAFFSRVGELLG